MKCLDKTQKKLGKSLFWAQTWKKASQPKISLHNEMQKVAMSLPNPFLTKRKKIS